VHRTLPINAGSNLLYLPLAHLLQWFHVSGICLWDNTKAIYILHNTLREKLSMPLPHQGSISKFMLRVSRKFSFLRREEEEEEEGSVIFIF